MHSSISKPTVLGKGPFKIKIIGSSNVLREVNCRLFFDRPFTQILKKYASLMNLHNESVKFTFNGKEILKSSTPKSLIMNFGDVLVASRNFNQYEDIMMSGVNVNQPVIGNKIPTSEKSSIDANPTEDLSTASSNVQLPIIGQGPIKIKITSSRVIYKEVEYRATSNETFAKIRQEYASFIGVEHRSFKFAFKGITVKLDATASGLNEWGGDVILVCKKACNRKKIKVFDTSNAKEMNSYIPNTKISSNSTDKNTKTTEVAQELIYDDTPDSFNINDDAVITVKFVDNMYNKVSLDIPVQTSIYNIIDQYESLVGSILKQLIMVYNGRILNYDETPLTVNMIYNAVIQVYTEKDEIDMVRASDDSEVLFHVPLVTFMKNIGIGYATFVGINSDVILIYNGRFIKDYDTPLSLKMRENDIIKVYTEDDKIDIMISLQYETSNELTSFSLNYGDFLDNIIKEYTNQKGIELTSVRFMLGERRIKSGQTLKEAEIPPNAAIQVFKEYQTINLKLLDYRNSSNIVQIKARYDLSISKILENSPRFEYDHSNIGLARWGVPGDIILGHQTPKELEMSNNDIIMFYRKPEIELKVNKSLISEKNIKIEDQHNTNINFKVVFEHTPEINFRTDIDVSFRELKKEIAHKIGKSVSCLRFLFDGNRILDDQTPESLEMEENDVIEVDVNYINIV